MTHTSNRLAKFLTYSGTLPLLAASIAPDLLRPWVDPTQIALTYGAIILSFIAGIHLAAFLFYTERCPRHLLLASNVIALIAWATLWVTQASIAASFQLISFLCLLGLDNKLHHAAVLPRWFFNLRCNATAIVVVCLAITAART